ncbi:MAG: hypothetical protein M0Z72_07535 [Deltaproteobacteria bacterium]|nr:hypothetical protein [Deltaproteobacteria bacterium]
MKKINFNLTLKIISGCLILFSCIFLIKLVKIYKKYAPAKALYFTSLNKKNTLSVKLRKLRAVSLPKSFFSSISVSTELLTFLSFSNYINYKGYNGIVYLKAGLARVKPGTKSITAVMPAAAGSYLPLNSYIFPSRAFYGINKLNIVYKLKKYDGLKTVLKIIRDIQELFPSRINKIFITNNAASINFSIYGG